MRTVAWLGALATAVTLAGCEGYGPPPPAPGAPVGTAAPAAATAPACFRTHDIRNHTVGDDHTLYLNVEGRMVYRVDMSSSCLAAATSSDPIIIQNPPGSSYVCRPIDLDVSISLGGSVNHCIVKDVVLLSPTEVAALPPKLRP
jgi:hypothetical protein